MYIIIFKSSDIRWLEEVPLREKNVTHIVEFFSLIMVFEKDHNQSSNNLRTKRVSILNSDTTIGLSHFIHFFFNNRLITFYSFLFQFFFLNTMWDSNWLSKSRGSVITSKLYLKSIFFFYFLLLNQKNKWIKKTFHNQNTTNKN